MLVVTGPGLCTARMTVTDYAAHAADGSLAVQSQLNFEYIKPGSPVPHVLPDLKAANPAAVSPSTTTALQSTIRRHSVDSSALQQPQLQRKQQLLQLQQQKLQLQQQQQQLARASQTTQGQPQRPKIAFGR